MINIQRNFFVENILLEAKINEEQDISQIPYKDSISHLSNNLSLIFIDVDRLKNSNSLKHDIKSLKQNNQQLEIRHAATGRSRQKYLGD